MNSAQKNLNRPNHTRRNFISALGALSMMGLAPSLALATNKDHFSSLSPTEVLRTYIRLMGSLKPMTTYTWFSGELWAIRPNKTPLPLVSFQGLAKNIWSTEGKDIYVKEAFDCGFFGDLETGKKINSFVNPINDETVEPYHFLYGGGKSTYSEKGVEAGGSTKPLNPKWIQSGDQVWIDEIGYGSTNENPINPDNWPRESAGETLYFGSNTSFITAASELLNPENSYAPYNMSWTAIAPWEPWLLMGDAPGFVQWRATGRKLSNHTEAPEDILAHIQETQPNFLDQGRPWQGHKSSWKSFIAERKPKVKALKID